MWAGSLIFALGLIGVAVNLRAQAASPPLAGSNYRLWAPEGGAAWLVTPSGRKMLLRAVGGLQLDLGQLSPSTVVQAAVDQRGAAVIAALADGGFNAIGPGSDANLWQRGMPHVQLLSVSAHLRAAEQTPLFDVFAPEFAAHVRTLAQQACTPQAGNANLIGYLSDNGLSWDPALHPGRALAYFLHLPDSSPGRQRAENYLRMRYDSSIQALRRAWGVSEGDFISLKPPPSGNAAFRRDAQPFGEEVLVRYLQVVANAIHAADPNHLYLGAALRADTGSGTKPDSNAALAWTIPDVASVEIAPGQDALTTLRAVAALARRPVLAEIAGCGAPPLKASDFALPELIGYWWEPSGDWQTSTCAQAAGQFWTPLNQAMAGFHAGSGGG